MSTSDTAFIRLVHASADWSSNHMDQWEKFKFNTDYGPIYITISMKDQYPDSFDLVDRNTGALIRQAGVQNV